MKFRLIYKKLGVKATDTFAEFEYPQHIRDIHFVKDIGFLCLTSDSMLLITNDGCRKVLSIDNPMSICDAPSNKVYIAYGGGIKVINCMDQYYASDFLGDTDYKHIFGKLSKIGIHGVTIDALQDLVFMAIAPLNKVYKIRKGSLNLEFGNGVAEYSVSNNIKSCSLNNPTGVVAYDKNTFFVSDTSNGCIRSFGDKHRVITGKPPSTEITPTKLLLDRKRNLIYYLSKNYLRSVTIDGNKDVPLYEGRGITSMSLNDSGKNYVLEEINE